MSTKLTKPVSRETNRTFQKRPVIITIAPLGKQDEVLIGLRLKGTRVQYTISLSEVYCMAAMRYANRELAAKKAARKAGVPWHVARRQFIKENVLP